MWVYDGSYHCHWHYQRYCLLWVQLLCVIFISKLHKYEFRRHKGFFFEMMDNANGWQTLGPFLQNKVIKKCKKWKLFSYSNIFFKKTIIWKINGNFEFSHFCHIGSPPSQISFIPSHFLGNTHLNFVPKS